MGPSITFDFSILRRNQAGRARGNSGRPCVSPHRNVCFDPFWESRPTLVGSFKVLFNKQLLARSWRSHLCSNRARLATTMERKTVSSIAPRHPISADLGGMRKPFSNGGHYFLC